MAGDTEGDGDDAAADTFNRTRSTQREFTNATESYRDTYDRYQDAQASGNTTAARSAARELESVSDRVVTLNDSLQRNYTTLSNRTGVATDTTSAVVGNTTLTIVETQADVRAETFVETDLTVETNGSSVAFDDPMAITVGLTTANGTAMANETLGVTVAGRVYSGQTDGEGRFDIVYRPVSLPLDASEVSVRYLPRETSGYLGASDLVTVDVSQVTPTVIVTNPSGTASYGEPVTADIEVTVDGRPVPALPLVATVGASQVSGTTTASG